MITVQGETVRDILKQLHKEDEKYTFTKAFDQESFTSFIIDLLDCSNYYLIGIEDNFVRFELNNINHWKVKRAIYERLSVPERKENFMVFTTCSCIENTDVVDRNCPIHGENNQL